MYLFLDSISYQPQGAEAPVLDRVSLYAKPGQIVSVVGQTEAGQSALLRFVGKRSDGCDGVFTGSNGDPEWEPGQPMPWVVRGWRFCFPYDMFGPEWRTEEWRGVPIIWRSRTRRPVVRSCASCICAAFPGRVGDGDLRHARGRRRAGGVRLHRCAGSRTHRAVRNVRRSARRSPPMSSWRGSLAGPVINRVKLPKAA